MRAEDNIDKLFENQIAIVNLISALAEKLIGQKPIISMHLEDGSIVSIKPTTYDVTWYQGDSQEPCLFEKEKTR
jgi:hypothetical protein